MPSTCSASAEGSWRGRTPTSPPRRQPWPEERPAEPWLCGERKRPFERNPGRVSCAGDEGTTVPRSRTEATHVAARFRGFHTDAAAARSLRLRDRAALRAARG